MATETMDVNVRSSHGMPALLRHRMFPRAMAWDLHQNAAATGMAPPRHGTADGEEGDQRRQKAAKMDTTASSPPLRHGGMPFALGPPSVGGREQLFRTIGKWLDPHAPSEDTYNSQSAEGGYAAFQRPPPPRPPSRQQAYVSSTAVYAVRTAADQHRQESAAYNMATLSRAVASPTPRSTTSTHSMAVASSVGHHHHQQPSPTNSQSSTTTETNANKKRPRGPTGSIAPPPSSSSGTVARPGMSTSSAKRCSTEGCGKIAVSKGLCRGHGGGRRCTFAGCTKCAQSRSPYCWAHGGGKRCEAPNCRRSRKTKRFCVDHVDMETTTAAVAATHSTDSDDSGDQHSHPTSSDTETTTMATATVVPRILSASALHLPSLSDALKRAVPAAVARATSQQTVSLPQSFDRLWSVEPPAATSTLTDLGSDFYGQLRWSAQ